VRQHKSSYRYDAHMPAKYKSPVRWAKDICHAGKGWQFIRSHRELTSGETPLLVTIIHLLPVQVLYWGWSQRRTIFLDPGVHAARGGSIVWTRVFQSRRMNPAGQGHLHSGHLTRTRRTFDLLRNEWPEGRVHASCSVHPSVLKGEVSRGSERLPKVPISIACGV
jgi:hypothetical protein